MAFDGDPASLLARGEGETTCPERRARRIRGSSPLGCRFAGLLLIAPATLGIAAARPTAPIGVAPGGKGDTTLASACTSFHWGPSQTPLRFELVVYPVDESSTENHESATGSSGEIEPALTVVVPGTASGWTPSLDQCLKTGATYAWSLRAIQRDGPSAWAAPLFFRVPEGPSPAEIALVLDLLRELQRASPEAIASEPENALDRHTDAEALPEPPGAGQRAIQAGIIEPPGPAVFTGGGPASLRVGGELRSVDSTGEPRLWGKGRPGAKIHGPDDGSGEFCSQGSIRFGLSEGVADWGSADSACPEGTWVCRRSEIEAAPACDTARPDRAIDLILCDGSPGSWPANNHVGWLADQADQPESVVINLAIGLSESDSFTTFLPCSSFSVWCCLD